MRGASRDSLAAGRDRLEALLDTKGRRPRVRLPSLGMGPRDKGSDAAALGEDLLGVTGVLILPWLVNEVFEALCWLMEACCSLVVRPATALGVPMALVLAWK